MAHDFKKFPELTNNQMNFYYFESPHRQITESFTARCVSVHDGDSIKLRWHEREFDFPFRIKDLLAPELSEEGGIECRDWLAERILGQEVDLILDPKDRVDRWGRLLGRVSFQGMDLGDEMINMGLAVAWEDRPVRENWNVGKWLI